MNKILKIYKPIGITPLQAISSVRQKYPHYENIKIGYAGRLDPMAHGIMLLMLGEATKKREKYLRLNKQYIFEVLFGVTTDTYDILGIITQHKSPISAPQNMHAKIHQYVSGLTTTFLQPYPPYSSKTVNGKPLFWWSRENRLSEITIPSRKIKISQFTLLSLSQISRRDLSKQINERLSLIMGDFRQKEIQTHWKKYFADSQIHTYTTAKFHIKCSSGTYIRSLTHALGEFLGTGAIAIDILRTKVGRYSLSENIR